MMLPADSRFVSFIEHPPAGILLAFLTALILTPVLRAASFRLGLFDIPNERSSHRQPTPRTGGVAIVAGIALSAWFGDLFHAPGWVPVLATAGLIALLGLIDDFRSLPGLLRLLVQIGCAVMVLVLSPGLTRLDFFHSMSVPLGFAGVLVLGSIWIAGVTNAFNFMDGINGIAGLEAVICGITLAGLLAFEGDAAGAILAAGLAAATAGFLPWNLPGWIFMGDVGSGTLGFLLAILALRVQQQGGLFLAAVLPLLPFLLDTAATLLRRIWRREPFLTAHRAHFYQQLTDLGWTHLQVTAAWGLLAAVSSLSALQWKSWPQSVQILVLLMLLSSQLAFGAWIRTAHRRKFVSSL